MGLPADAMFSCLGFFSHPFYFYFCYSFIFLKLFNCTLVECGVGKALEQNSSVSCCLICPLVPVYLRVSKGHPCSYHSMKVLQEPSHGLKCLDMNVWNRLISLKVASDTQ